MSLTKALFSKKIFLVNLVLIGIMIGFVAAFSIFAGGGSGNGRALAYAQSAPPSPSVSQAIEQAGALQTAFNYVAETVLPSVVELSVIGSSSVPQSGEFPWRFFFGDPELAPEERQVPPQRQEQGLGSGVIVRRAGDKVYVLTNNHVIAGATSITLKLYDEREFKASVVGTDERKDLAIVVFDTKDQDIRVATLGNSDALKVGDWAIAIGSPFGLFSSVTTGIVSAIGRDGGPQGNINDFIQTDAAINRGNSGGALANIRGEIIGINTWIASNTGGSIGLGFSIPINNAKRVIDDLISRGSVRYGWLGVLLGTLERTSLSELGISDRRGAFIGHVFTDGPAGKAGLRSGDFVLSIDGRSVANVDQLVRIVGDLAPGSRPVFSIIREAKKLDVQVRIEERDESSAADYSKLWPGLEVLALTPEHIEAQKLAKNQKGVTIGSIIARSPSAFLSLRAGDVITAVNGAKVSSVGDFYRLINDPKATKIQFEVYRAGQKLDTLALVRK
ncbi:MAG TPA: serine protease [Spirochaetaceae bacterium]|jgi:Do/DeqQ family serine protease|nr:serine protease [Spirochaetaceae bacterium]